MGTKNPEFVAWVHTLRCRMWMQDPCEGRIHAHHAGVRGLGQKAPDNTCIPLCEKHHRAWHDVRSPFDEMGRRGRQEWRDAQIEWTQAQWARAKEGLPVTTFSVRW